MEEYKGNENNHYETLQKLFINSQIGFMERMNKMFADEEEKRDNFLNVVFDKIESTSDSPAERENARFEKAKKTYLELYDDIKKKDRKDPYAIFDLIKTGVFDTAQAEALKAGLNNNLTIRQILEYATPDLTAEQMMNCLELLKTARAKCDRDNRPPEEATIELTKFKDRISRFQNKTNRKEGNDNGQQ